MLSTVLILNDVNNKEQFSDSLPPESDTYMKRKSPYLSTDLFIECFRQQFLKHKTPEKAILILDCHRTQCSSPLFFQTAVENNVTTILLLNLCTHALQSLAKFFGGGRGGPLMTYCKKEATACKIPRYRKALLIGFAWSKVASVGIGVGAFESTGNYPFNSNLMPEYFFSISDNCGTIRSMETASPNMALVCVPSTSVTSSQNMLPTSAEVPLNTLSTILPSDIFPEEITSPRLLKISPVPKKPENIQLRKEGLSFFLSLKKLILSRKSEINKEEIKSKSREIGK